MDRKNLKKIMAFALCLMALWGCKKEGDTPDPVIPPAAGSQKVFVVCEGSLGNGNSTLGLYLPEKDSAYMDIYKSVNNQDLGDIFQSMMLVGDRYLLCINNSDKIIAINRNTWLLDGTIQVAKPRYILPVSTTKAYVSSLFTNQFFTINPQSLTNISTLTLPYKNGEGMLEKNGTGYIACWDTACRQLTTINTTTDQLNAPIPLPGTGPQEVLIDKNQQLWVLAGNATQGKQATLTCIDPTTGQTVKSYAFAVGADPIRPVFNPTKDTLYFIEVNYNGGSANNGIFRMSINDANLPQQPFIAAQGFQYFWALGIQPATGNIYVGDPKGFTQRGSVTIYNQQGTVLKSFLTGIGPGHFFFD